MEILLCSLSTIACVTGACAVNERESREGGEERKSMIRAHSLIAICDFALQKHLLPRPNSFDSQRLNDGSKRQLDFTKYKTEMYSYKV